MAKTTEQEGIIEFSLYAGKCKGKFYGPTEEKQNRHMYYVNDERKTGVTTYIGIKDKSKGLVIWATELFRDALLAIVKKEKITEDHIWDHYDIHEREKQKAADIGSQIHDWVEKHINGLNPEMPEMREVQIGVTAFLEWKDANKVKFLSSERVIYSKKHDYIGKMDIEAKVNGKLCLIDIKSSNDLRNDYLLQTAAYVKADEEESDRKYDGRWLIRVAKESEKDYLIRMEKKNKNRIKNGKDPIEYPAYKVFEAMYLDSDEGNMDRDFKAFLSAMNLYRWNNETDFFLNRDKKQITA